MVVRVRRLPSPEEGSDDCVRVASEDGCDTFNLFELVGGDRARVGWRAPVIADGGGVVVLAPRSRVRLREGVVVDTAAGPGWRESPAAGRVQETKEPFLGCDKPGVGVDKALSVGGAGCLGVPEGPFGSGEPVAGGVPFDHVTFALGGHISDLLEGGGEFSGDL